MDKSKFIVLLMAAVGLVWAGTAAAIDVPGSSFEYPDAIGDGSWAYVKDIPGCDWTAVKYTGNPWIGQNYWWGTSYPGVGHTGDSYLKLNAGYIYQSLSGETWVEGVTYDLGIWVTTKSTGQRLITYVMADGDWANRIIIGDVVPAVQPDLQTWIQLTAQYTATADYAGKDIGIGFYGRSNTFADDVTIVPEPITLGLLGLGGLGLIRRKRR